MIDVAVLRKIRSDLKGITTRNPQRFDIESFCFSHAYDGDTFLLPFALYDNSYKVTRIN